MTTKPEEEKIHKVRIENKKLDITILGKDWISITIASIALLISAIALLQSFGVFSSPQLDILVGNTYIYSPDTPKGGLLFTISFPFNNQGDKSILIREIYAEVMLPNNQKIKFIPSEIEIKETNHLRNSLHDAGFGESFVPFFLNPNDKMLRYFIFTPESTSNIPMVINGDYKIDIFVMTDQIEKPKNK